jgi:outer membrane protein assembly factor BamD
MNRLSIKIAAVALAVLALGDFSSASTKKPKKKKDQDLSANPLKDVKSKQPDKELYDKALLALKKGRFDVARLDLQTMLNTYPESEYRMRAKLAIGDSWFKEGGTAALTQAEAEYKDFITFFPTAPEAAEAQMKVADIYYQQMEKPDRDYTNAQRAEQEYRNMINQPSSASATPTPARAAPFRWPPTSPAPSRNASAPLTRTRPPRPTPRSSPATPWRPMLKTPATAWWP